MKKQCESCHSCGMTMEKLEDFALSNPASRYCNYCVDTIGNLLPYETILKNNADYFKESQGITYSAATELAKELLKNQPAWQNKS